MKTTKKKKDIPPKKVVKTKGTGGGSKGRVQRKEKDGSISVLDKGTGKRMYMPNGLNPNSQEGKKAMDEMVRTGKSRYHDIKVRENANPVSKMKGRTVKVSAKPKSVSVTKKNTKKKK